MIFCKYPDQKMSTGVVVRCVLRSVVWGSHSSTLDLLVHPWISLMCDTWRESTSFSPHTLTLRSLNHSSVTRILTSLPMVIQSGQSTGSYLSQDLLCVCTTLFTYPSLVLHTWLLSQSLRYSSPPLYHCRPCHLELFHLPVTWPWQIALPQLKTRLTFCSPPEPECPTCGTSPSFVSMATKAPHL